MSTTDVLDATAIQDTLFGDPKVLEVKADAEPDSPCFCVCACKDSDTRISNARLGSAAAWVGSPQP